VSIGRGAFYDPWIFKRTREYCGGQTAAEDTKKNSGSTESRRTIPAEPPFTERVRILRRHLDLMIEVFGEELGCRMFRKVAPWYAKRFGPCHEFNKQVVQLATRAQFEEILERYIRWRQQFVDETGELLPRFRQPPMVASFMRENETANPSFRGDEPASTRREQIPVPRGPVEVW